ncbi:MAG: helix-turn-helix domain-containing protein [Burkholderiaceae bacterium]|nr:helix-turn-helix domain-containing protein [Burkholderiaceae bacterium]
MTVRSHPDLRESDLRAAFDTLWAVGEACAGCEAFALSGVRCLPALVSSELTTLSICDLDAGHRTVVSDQPGAISRRDIEVFDQHFHAHPLVRAHGRNPRAASCRIEDVLPQSQFRSTPLYHEYYRAIRIDHVMAVPIHVDRRFVVSFVFNRRGIAFSDRDRACMELIRRHLGQFYRLFCTPLTATLTPREREVLHWVAGGKTDRDIAAILGMSPRTVQKHLQRVYAKLGVETRTAAVMRAMRT